MKTKTYSLLALAGWLLVSAMFQPVHGQENTKAAVSSGFAERTLQYFEMAGKGDLGDYLKSIRPPGISAEQRARLVSMIRKEDIVSPSIQRQAKLDALRPVLEYHERSTVEIKILRLGLAWAGMLEGAAVVVSEEAVDVLAAEELQAVVAHELGHEYFAAEYEAARKSKQYDLVKEVELRCDAIAVITLSRLRLNPELLVSGVSKLTRFNEARGVSNNPNLVTSVDERRGFCQEMMKLAEIRVGKAGDTASK
jgi:Peptidase family M48